MGAGSADIRGRGADAPVAAGPARRLDGAAFATLFQQSARALWAIAAAIVRDGEEAHDIVQEAAMMALAKMDEFDASTNFAAWAGQFVRYTALNERRRRRREKARVEGMGPGAPTGSSPSGNDETVAAALDELDQTARECVLMRVVTGMSYSEISAALGIPEGTAMSHVHRSRLRVRDAILAEGRG